MAKAYSTLVSLRFAPYGPDPIEGKANQNLRDYKTGFLCWSFFFRYFLWYSNRTIN